MGKHGQAWASMGKHGQAWASMGKHGQARGRCPYGVLGFGWRRGWRRVGLGGVGLVMAIALFMLHSWLGVHLRPSLLDLSVPGMFVLPKMSMAPEMAIAQGFDRRVMARFVYQQLPDLPLENHYVHTETGEVASDNTLVYRLIQYHYNVRRRPLTSRFDWKLTLADYLGVNEWITPEIYPDRWLTSNPYEHDIAIVQSLNRQQREALVQALLAAIIPQ
ncbi:MAG: hypothetical protein AB4042_02480 [Leptolyngbyaceae cyanobacterium]